MTTPFKIEAKDISALDEVKLTQLLQVLLYLEAGAHGLAKRSVDVALNIKVGDGGEDGSVNWIGEPKSTDFFPLQSILFQNKATSMTKAAYAKEIVTKGTAKKKATLKPRVEEVLDAGGAYITFTTQKLNASQKKERVDEVRKKLKEFGKVYADTCEIDIYDASKISGWVNLFVPAIAAVNQWVGRPMLPGLKTFSLWSQSSDISNFKYCVIDSRKKIIDCLRDGLIRPKSAFRITGLSGIGKTRTAYEIFNGQPNLESQVIYFDAAHSSEIKGLVADWVSLDIGAILVVDNCDLSLHQSLVDEVLRGNSKISLLTLDYNIGQVGHPTTSFQLAPLKDEEIIQFLKPVYENRINNLDLERIAQFAQGFPQMAVLLAVARLADDPNIGKLNNDQLAQRLLWNKNESPNTDYEKVLQVCSLYDSFGVDGNLEDQLKYIAKVANVSIDTCFECIQKYTQRGIVDRRGRLGQITPKPLAILLASQWWERTRSETQLELIKSTPDGMIERFCEQIRKLDFSPKVKTLTESLCGKQGPFGQAEMILSVRGSLLFRAFVEVSPSITSKSLHEILNSLTHEELLKIDGDVRRNLVWALEKLCFRSEVFERSAWCLLLLASAENETWSNNATGNFKQLFKVWLSGTEANPEQRFRVIEKAINSENANMDNAIIGALESAISTNGGTRTIGAERQGTQPALEEWNPKLWQEVFDYWDLAVKFLFQLYERNDVLRQKIVSILGSSVRPLFHHGRVDLLNGIIGRIVRENGRYWPTALASLRAIAQYDLTDSDDSRRKIVDSWLDLLDANKGDITERLQGIVTNPPWETRQDTSGNYIDVAGEKAELLAIEIGKHIESLFPHLNILSNGEQKQAWNFGRKLATIIPDYESLLSHATRAYSEAHHPNAALILGIIQGIHLKSREEWECLIDELATDEVLRPLYPLLISTGTISEKHLEFTAELAHRREIAPHQVSQLANGNTLRNLNERIIVDFCKKLTLIGDGFEWSAVDIVFMYQFSSPEKLGLIRDGVIDILTSVDVSKNGFGGNRGEYQWKELIEKLLINRDEDLAMLVTKQILKATDQGFDHGHLWQAIKPVLNDLIKNYWELLWPLISEAIEKAEGLQFYWMQQLLDREDSFSNLQESLLNNIPVTTIIDWCRKNPERGPIFVASCINIFKADGGRKVFSDLFVALLDNFGDNEKVKSALSANMHTRGWVGSLVPYLEADREAFLTLKDHRNELVREWAEQQILQINHQIDYESGRDEERDMEVF